MPNAVRLRAQAAPKVSVRAVRSARARAGSAQGGCSPSASGVDAATAWFASRGWEAWPFQRAAWEAFGAGRSGLIRVPTGAGKTFGACMGPLIALRDEQNRDGGVRPGLRLLYTTPLRAVARDVEAALREAASGLGLPIRVESRTGDTSASLRAKQAARLPHVLVTTPESLAILLTRENASELFSSLLAVVLDEWHELMSSKRGALTELSLTRVRRFAPGVRTWALSATAPNVQEAARTATGARVEPVIVSGEEMERPVVIDAVLPADPTRLPWAGHMGLVMLPDVLAALDPEVSTLIFCNTRSQAERWHAAIKYSKPEWGEILALHHGSIDREERARVESGLKRGAVRITVATSSLDLGVDFGPVERVLQIGSPKGIARLVQRAGRSSHRPRTPCRITCVPTHAMELVEIAAARSALARGNLEARPAHDKPLDALAQHMVTCALGGGFAPDELFEEIRGAWSYRGLTREEFDRALRLAVDGGSALGAYPQFRRLTPVGERFAGPSARLALLHRMNIGAITAPATVEIAYEHGRTLGHIEDSFVASLRPGAKFVFAGKTLAFVKMRENRALVRAARGRVTFTPIWGGASLPISETLGGAVRSTLARAAEGRIGDDEVELQAAAGLIETQRRLSALPRADDTLIEVISTREGCAMYLFPFEGRLVNAGLAAILSLRLSRLTPATFAIAANDYGCEILCAHEFPFRETLEGEARAALFSTEALGEDARASMNMSHLARFQFREVARVAGLIVQTHPGRAASGRHLQVSAGLLFDVLSEFDPENPLLEQSRREALDRHFERSRLGRTMARLAEGPLRIVAPRGPTPFSFPLMLERQAGTLSSETIAERVRRMRQQWEKELLTYRSPGSG